MAKIDQFNFHQLLKPIRLVLVGILALVFVVLPSIDSPATTPEAAYIHHIGGSDLFIGAGASNSREAAHLNNELQGNRVLYVPGGRRGWANLRFVYDWPIESANLLVQAGPDDVASQWSFPCTASGGFRMAWTKGSNRGCKEGVRVTASVAGSQGRADPNGEDFFGSKGVLRTGTGARRGFTPGGKGVFTAQAGVEEMIVVPPPNNESALIQTHSSNTRIEVDTILGDVQVKSVKSAEGRRIPEGQRYSYIQDTTTPIDRNAILNSPEMQDFLNPNNWMSPGLPDNMVDDLNRQLTEMRTALGLGVAGDLIAIAGGSGRITRSEYPNVVPVGTNVNQVSGAYDPSTGKIRLEIEGRQAEITLNTPLTDGTPIPFTVTRIIPRYVGDQNWNYVRQFSHLAIDAVVKDGIQTRGTLIKQGNQIQGNFSSQAKWRSDKNSTVATRTTNGSVEGEFSLTLQPGVPANNPVFRNYTPGTWTDTAVRAGW